MSSPKSHLERSNNYAMFVQSRDNREVRLNGKKRSDLRQSMSQYGFMPSYPISVVRLPSGKLLIKDGQHRFAVAQELHSPIWYVVITDEQQARVDIAFLNNTQVPWNVVDYAERYKDKPDYAELLEFARRYGLPISSCLSMLANRNPSGSRNLMNAFKDGKFKITTREQADRVARLYTEFRRMSKCVATRFFMKALFAVCLCEGMDDERLLKGATRCHERLVSYGTFEGYLQMLEDVYNFGRMVRQPLKIQAENELRKRNKAVPKDGNPDSQSAAD